MIKKYVVSKANYKTIISQIVSSIQSNEKVVLEISMNEYYIINEVIKYLRSHGLSVVDGDNNDEIIKLFVVKRD
ncbi:MAG: hypothetical protein ACP5GI_00355 [Sulfolobales archaeon]